MEIENLTKEIRDAAFERKKDTTPDQVAASWYNDDLTYNGVHKTLFMILPTPGCWWALGDSGGCTMCSYVSDCTLEPIESEDIVRIFNEHLERFDLKSEEYVAVKLFASGSFLNPYELPVEARNRILETLRDMDNVREIIVESRPEYVTEEVLDEVFDVIGDKLFEVSIGLETSDDDTRLNKINKGFTCEDFENAINVIHKARDEKGYNLKAKAYVFVKPILVGERKAIDEAIQTAEYCSSVGIDRLSFCPATIHGGTLIEKLWRNGSYQPPWIWSAVEIINTVRKNIDIPALMDTSGFGSRRGPYNCKKCSKELKHKIIDSNLDQSIIEHDCECKDQWKADVNCSEMNQSTSFTKHLPFY